jgi:hypothetical protein
MVGRSSEMKSIGKISIGRISFGRAARSDSIEPRRWNWGLEAHVLPLWLADKNGPATPEPPDASNRSGPKPASNLSAPPARLSPAESSPRTAGFPPWLWPPSR